MGVLKRVRYEKVAQGLILGKTNYDSCLQAGYKDIPSLHAHASKICNRKVIQERVTELQEELASKYLLDREQILVVLGKIIDKSTDGNKIRAAHLAAQMQGLLQNTLDVNVRKSVENLTDEELLAIVKKDMVDEKEEEENT